MVLPVTAVTVDAADPILIPAAWLPVMVDVVLLVRLAIVLLVMVNVPAPEGILIPLMNILVVLVLMAWILLAVVRLPIWLPSIFTVPTWLSNIPEKLLPALESVMAPAIFC